MVLRVPGIDELAEVAFGEIPTFPGKEPGEEFTIER